VEVERRYRRALMSSFHGLFSLGGLVGAGAAGLAMSCGVGDVQHVTLITFLPVCVVGFVLRWFPPSPPQQESHSPTFVKPTGVLLGLGILAFFALLTEEAMADWSAVYLHDVLGVDSATAAVGFTACSLLMAAGRFGGDALANHFGPQRVLHASGTLAAVGLGGGLLIGEPLAAILGFGLVGLGIANIIPVLFSTAGRIPGVQAGTALAAVATTGYCGFLAGPPLIGLAAEITSLPIALGIVSACCTFIAVSAGVVFRPLRVPDDTAGTSAQTGGIGYRGVMEKQWWGSALLTGCQRYYAYHS
jgi:fucose permease